MVFYKNLGLTDFAMIGVFVFVGGGIAHFVLCPFMHQNAIINLSGAGGAIALGAGEALFVLSPMLHEYGLSSFYGVGGDIFVGGQTQHPWGPLQLTRTSAWLDSAAVAVAGVGRMQRAC